MKVFQVIVLAIAMLASTCVAQEASASGTTESSGMTGSESTAGGDEMTGSGSTTGSAGDNDGGVKPGGCTSRCPTTIDYICGSDGKTYDNGCRLKNAVCSNEDLKQVSKGKCPEESKDDGSSGDGAASTTFSAALATAAGAAVVVML